MKRTLCVAGSVVCSMLGSTAEAAWDTWPPRDFLLKSLVAGIEPLLKSQDPETGQFGSKPWICNDQNVLLPLAAAWSIEDPNNPWYHSEPLLSAIAKGGEALVDAQDERGAWTFRKKDNSTWGQVHQPWTYSRWVRAYQLVREALPPPSRARWEEGLRLGFTNIRKAAASSVGNMTAHNMMALYVAGICFDDADWRTAATGYLERTVDEQEEGGYWSEHCGPLIGYGRVYVELLGLHYHFSREPLILAALQRAAAFHASVLLPDGSNTPGIDERQLYHGGVDIGNVGFSWTDEGRGYLAQQLWRRSEGGTRLVDADYAANMLLCSGSGAVAALPSAADESTTVLTTISAATKRIKPWQWTFSAYPCRPPNYRWVQDRQNLIDIYHDALGLVIGGGNTKLQPYWSTFTVGDPELLKHTPGDINPNFTPDIDLLWTPDMASVNVEPRALRLALKFGPADLNRQIGHGPFRVRAEADAAGEALTLTFTAPRGRRAEAHLPMPYRGANVACGDGRRIRLGEEALVLPAAEVGGHIVYYGLKVTIPEGSRLLWPVLPHDPYKRDGSAELSSGKLVLAMPFDAVDAYTVTLTHQPVPPFDGLVFEARELPVEHSEGTYTKRLDSLGSQFMGKTQIGSVMTFQTPDIAAGRYALFVELVLANEYGVVQVSVDEQDTGSTFDAYCDGVDTEGERVACGDVTLAAGAHRLAVRIVGKNEKSRSQTISVKRWLLKPLRD
ncbi:MAG: hypothetical protein A3K19_23870 [Lentisphaerae bacterium RIFOXYB12_FULL_65_16]|nr:MAG: hypothetical protein A3K18_30715 [Lentisphaerae bacterium RIFOXYA12_64_32]OGV89628.1 MAG: hypothetical protein A3K19_23870 [Lentisphaerae bacterium RIFOXYB12_FULL_65_16]